MSDRLIRGPPQGCARLLRPVDADDETPRSPPHLSGHVWSLSREGAGELAGATLPGSGRRGTSNGDAISAREAGPAGHSGRLPKSSGSPSPPSSKHVTSRTRQPAADADGLTQKWAVLHPGRPGRRRLAMVAAQTVRASSVKLPRGVGGLERVPWIAGVGSGRSSAVFDRHDLTDEEWARLEP
jgi:hypothetical protein